jgi:hypothetical protein
MTEESESDSTATIWQHHLPWVSKKFNKLKNKLDDRRAARSKFKERPRKPSTSSSLQPPQDYVQWAVSKRYVASEDTTTVDTTITDSSTTTVTELSTSADTPQPTTSTPLPRSSQGSRASRRMVADDFNISNYSSESETDTD